MEHLLWADLWSSGACGRAVSGQSGVFLLWRYHLHVVTSSVHTPLNQHPHISKARSAVGHLDSCNMKHLTVWLVCGFPQHDL
jgi:hypothetical protein